MISTQPLNITELLYLHFTTLKKLIQQHTCIHLILILNLMKCYISGQPQTFDHIKYGQNKNITTSARHILTLLQQDFGYWHGVEN